MTVIDSIRRTIRSHRLLFTRSRVAVALSGGADSVALLMVLREIASTDGFQVVGVAHLNHQLRGADSVTDEEFCRRLADSLQLPIEVERVDVARLAEETGVSLEHAAHDARYAFFERAAAALGATEMAVAHTRDDQAETFLLRLLRGAGPRGLGGMHPRSGAVIRPFIQTSRADLRDFLCAARIDFREDRSNSDVSIPRNRIRHELMPLLEHFSPGIVDVLDREAAIAREDAEYLENAARAAATRIVSPRADGVSLDPEALIAAHPAIARRVIQMAQQMAAGKERFIGFDAIEAVRLYAVSKSTGQLDLPGHRVNRRAGSIVLTGSRGREKAPPAGDFTYQLEVPGHVAVPEAGCAIHADTTVVPPGRKASELWRLAGRGEEAHLEAGLLARPLSVRNRRPGDVFRPLGLNGRKKLQDFFVDAKIDRFERDVTPVIVDSSGQIVWVAGHAVAEEFRVTEATRDVVILKRTPI